MLIFAFFTIVIIILVISFIVKNAKNKDKGNRPGA